MRIGIEAQRIFRKKKHGMDIVALELIKALQLIDQTNQYFIFVKKGDDNGCIQESSNFKIVEVPGLTYADWEQIFLPLSIRKYNIDVLHCTSNTAPLFCPAPTIITLHDVIFMEQSKDKAIGNWYQQLGRIYRKYIVPASIKNTKHIITVSNYEKERISNTLNVGNDKISVIYNAYGSHFKVPEKAELLENIRNKYKLPEGYIFYIGNTDPKKNMTNTLSAYARYAKSTIDNLKLVIADVSQATLDELIVKLNLQTCRKHIQLTGYIDNSDLPLIYAGASVFLYPSLRESFGIPVLESMACGTPVITSNTSALPEVAGLAALLVDPTNEEDITQALQRSLNNLVLRKAMITMGFDRIRVFSWNSSATNLLNLYKSLELCS